jgi:hypothetical protein
MDAGTTGRIAAGRYVLELGDEGGALVREASRGQRAHIHPRATPVLLRPRLIRGLLGRHTEIASAFSGLDAGLPVEVSGEAGIGKTALLRQLAHHSRSASFVDGVIYLSARRHSPLDLQQRIFEAFHESEEPCKPTDAEIRRGLEEKHALILLDDVRLSQSEIESVLDCAPRSSFVIATRERSVWGEARSIPLKGLPEADAVLLIEREIERPFDATERNAATNLCAVVAGHPLRLLQVASVIRERGLPSNDWLQSVTPEHLLADLLSSIDDKERRALLALTALPGVALHARHIAGIVEVTEIEPSLMTLGRRGLVTTTQSRHQLAHGVADRLRRTEDLKPWMNRAVTYFNAWADRHRRNMDALLEESDALMRVHQSAADNRRSEEVVALGRLLEVPLVLRARWGAWGVVIDRCLTTARATGDRATESWALHELGSRALCLGDAGAARVMLTQAVKLRDALSDRSAAAISQKNLDLVMPPTAPEPSEKPEAPIAPVAIAATPIAEVPIAPDSSSSGAPAFDLDSISLHDSPDIDVEPPAASAVSVLLLAALLAVSGGFGYWAFHVGRSLPPHEAERIVSMIRRELDASLNRWKATLASHKSHEPPGLAPREATIVDLDAGAQAEPPAEPVAPRAPGPAPSILIFSPRPGSITRGGPTNLCYAVSDASHARLEPGVGDVNPTRTLTCVRVSPPRTTTYELTASSPDGQQARQQLVIFVR